MRGGIAPIRADIPELLPDLLSGQVPDGYRAMDGRSALKVRITF